MKRVKEETYPIAGGHGDSSTSETLCSSVTAADGKVYYVVATLYRCPEEPDAWYDAFVDLIITNGNRAWARQGLGEAALGTTVSNSLRHALEALADLQPVTEQYTRNITFRNDNDDMFVEVEWDNRRHGKDVTPRVHFQVPLAADLKATNQEVMAAMLDACARYAAQSDALAQQCEEKQRVLQTGYAELEALGRQKEVWDEDTALKAAALLVAKDEKIIQLQQSNEKNG
jgi:hypothetical protein